MLQCDVKVKKKKKKKHYYMCQCHSPPLFILFFKGVSLVPAEDNERFESITSS
jgi:hypothetical protein